MAARPVRSEVLRCKLCASASGPFFPSLAVGTGTRWWQFYGSFGVPHARRNAYARIWSQNSGHAYPAERRHKCPLAGLARWKRAWSADHCNRACPEHGAAEKIPGQLSAKHGRAVAANLIRSDAGGRRPPIDPGHSVLVNQIGRQWLHVLHRSTHVFRRRHRTDRCRSRGWPGPPNPDRARDGRRGPGRWRPGEGAAAACHRGRSVVTDPPARIPTGSDRLTEAPGRAVGCRDSPAVTASMIGWPTPP
jgi:hypothetical protein